MAPAGPPPPSNDPRVAIARYVEQAHAALDRATYYMLLNVPSGSSGEVIRAAYYKLCSRLHPDLHGDVFPPELQRKLISVYSRLVEAYRVLSSGERRREYDRQLQLGKLRYDPGSAAAEKRRLPEDELPDNAKKFFKLGRAALQASDGKAAVMNLRLALSVAPRSPLIREELAKAEALAKSQGGTG